MLNSYLGGARVILGRVLSSALMLLMLFAGPLRAHEVLPSIADMTATDGELVFELNANVESFLAGIDLTAVQNTNDSAEAETYDALRALTPDEMQARFTEFWPELATQITVEIDGTAAALTLQSVTVDPVGNVDLPRTSQVIFSTPLTDGAQTVQFSWAPELGVLVLRQMGVPSPYDGYLEGGNASDVIPLAGGGQATAWEAFVEYIPVGFDHIVPKGLDHILFVLGLFFLAARARPLIIQVSLFTLAHTITLALAALGYVNIPGSIVEPLIAASIVFIAIENIWARGISRWRPFVIFGFGLLHGLGFASVLGEFGVPDANFIPALIGFNVGVEVGQLFVISIMFLCVWQALRIDRGRNEVGQGFALYTVLLIAAIALSILNPAGLVTVLENPVWVFGAPLSAIFVLCMMSIQFRDQQEAYRRLVAIPVSLAIAFVGAYWVIERVFL